MKKIIAISFVLVLMISGCIGSPTVDVDVGDIDANIDIQLKETTP